MTNNLTFILGSNPALSAVECYTALKNQQFEPNVTAASPYFLNITTNHPVPKEFLSRLGGTDRFGVILEQQTEPWAPDTAAAAVLKYLAPLPSRKATFGLSAINIKNSFCEQVGKAAKQIAREQSLKIRFILPQGRATKINAAQIIFNDLLSPTNADFIFIHDPQNHRYYLARTIAIQDIAAYELRDTQRPARDPYVGLLPPKLAQIMLNIVTANLPATATIYDPFCGMGTILQEGWLQGFTMIGSDKEPRMVEASEKNLTWISEQFSRDTESLPHVFQHDVLTPFDPALHGLIDAMVTEPYLGKPLRHPLLPDEVAKWTAPLQKLYLTFLRHAYPLLRPDAPLLLLLPAFRQPNQGKDSFTFFPKAILDAITKLGYIQHQLILEELKSYYSETPRRTLLYARPDALVGRELTLWKKH